MRDAVSICVFISGKQKLIINKRKDHLSKKKKKREKRVTSVLLPKL